MIKRAKNDYEVLAEMFELMPTSGRKMSMLEFAETTRIPLGQYKGSMFKNERAAYVKEPLSLLEPGTGIEEIVLMWASQTGKTNIGGIGLAHYMKVVPSEIMIVASDDAQARKIMNKRIIPRAIDLGIQFRSISDDGDRKVSNTMISKEFPGGNIDAASANSPAQLSSETKRIVLADEIDRWPKENKKEGSTLGILRPRMQAWGSRKKLLAISTPTLESKSVIYPMFLRGDRRYYNVPCPHCAELLRFVLYHKDRGGLYWKTDNNGRLISSSVEYICHGCGSGIAEKYRHGMLIDGSWIPTAAPRKPSIASFQLNSIYSPFKGWEEIVDEYLEALEDPALMRSFENTVMGMVHKVVGSTISNKKAIEHRGSYKSKEPQNEVLYITGGADIQAGKNEYSRLSEKQLEAKIEQMKTEGKNLWTSGLPRIELEILGHGAGYRTWSIEYKVFYGSVDNAYYGAFEKMERWISETGLRYTTPSGRAVDVQHILVDSGFNANVVYAFCESIPLLIPSKGLNEDKSDSYKEKTGDTTKGNKPYQVSKIKGHQDLIIINTNYYKTKIYNSLRMPRTSDETQKRAFADHPMSYSDYYFKMLTAEEQRSDGSFHSTGKRNEALDCKVMAMCAGDKLLDDAVEMLRKDAVHNEGMSVDAAKEMYTRGLLIKDMIDSTNL